LLTGTYPVAKIQNQPFSFTILLRAVGPKLLIAGNSIAAAQQSESSLLSPTPEYHIVMETK